MFAVNPLNTLILCYNKLIIMLRHKSWEEKSDESRNSDTYEYVYGL